MESHYNRTLEAHVNFTKFYEHFLNISRLNISQLVSELQRKLTTYHGVAVETTKNARNLTSELSTIINATVETNELSNTLKRNLSSAVDGSHVANMTHDNNAAILTELDMLVNAISDVVSNNITVLAQHVANISSEISTKVSEIICVR